MSINAHGRLLESILFVFQEDKRKKQALKDELAAKKKKEKELQKWESGSRALECITAEIDSSICNNGSIGGLSDFGESSCCTELSVNFHHIHIFYC
jgi:hypothetical protein